uniref:Glycosyl transferase CAP10 domain-containing protein n=1 Tax=Chromera velia CCMP2878 TaxID=1169474 RepID=A0A0G4IC69_9ALVE|eukprot:Cvel_13064.t1-p1 / transcript=Cvel_13064.t1 / gene=Cvel_13064 / organism=Chromera_velia_CCMP2878 / gene_product=hypothetical protein / transcript_product=hypothetical protein / location=Cvel_scaffold879:23156-24346(+) / protein_length=397 / sequence_SO=supercontig / SO=protein_coding / is_pseudo=false
MKLLILLVLSACGLAGGFVLSRYSTPQARTVAPPSLRAEAEGAGASPLIHSVIRHLEDSETKRDWNLSTEQLDSARMRLLDDQTFLGFVEPFQVPALGFLYAKGLWADYRPKRRSNFVRSVLEFPEGNEEFERLNRIVTKGEESSAVSSPNRQFDNFVARHPVWGDPKKSWIAFRDDPALKDKYVERVQKSGLCCMHGPVVVQHYAVARQSPPGQRVPMLDMAKFLRRHRGAKVLQKHILFDEGGSSIDFLKEILMSKSKVDENVSWKVEPEYLCESLQEHGPALVSQFKVHEDFNNLSTARHLGTPAPERPDDGLHAMAFVGYRWEAEQLRFLLQNWSPQKPFIEVDLEYLSSCSARLAFVRTPQTEIPKTFETDDAAHVELEVDCAERLPCEMLV